MKKQVKNFLIGASITAFFSAVAAAYAFSAKKLVEIALNRETPKTTERGKKRLCGSEKLSEMAELLMEATKALEEIPMERIEIKSDDETSLVGHWYCPNNPTRVIVAMHGWRSLWSQDFGAIAAFWLKNNCAVLFAEQRAQGNSGGEYMGFGLLERFDCIAWTKWVKERINPEIPLYLSGISMGATTVLMAAEKAAECGVSGIIADCGFTSPNAIWRHVANNNLKIPYGLYSAAANDLCRRRINQTGDSYSTTESLSNSETPVLFIHGTDDKFVPIEMTYENFKAAKGYKKLFIVPGAEHGMSYLEDRDGYERAVLEFFREIEK